MNPYIQAILLLLGGMVSALGLVWSAKYTSRSSVKVKQIDVEANAYTRAKAIDDAVILRMQGEVDAIKVKHEEQDRELKELRSLVEKVNRVFRVAINFIEQMLLRDRHDPHVAQLHIPEELKEYLDPKLIQRHVTKEEHHRTPAEEPYR